MKNLIKSVLLFASIVFQGCSLEPNTSVFIKRQVHLWGDFSPTKPIDYCAGSIEDMNGLCKLPEVTIELPHGSVLLSDLTPELLFTLASQNRRPHNMTESKRLMDPTELTRLHDPNDKALYAKRGFKIEHPNLFDAYSFYICDVKGAISYGFVFTHEKILKVEFCYHAVLLDSKQVKRYPFPITYKQAVELFGEPDKTYNIHATRL